MPYCPLCKNDTAIKISSATDVEYFTLSGSFNFWECGACKILFIDPLPADKLKIIYPENYYSFTEKHSSIAFRLKDWLDGMYYKKLLKQIHSDTLSVLDIGGGTGSLLDSIKKADSRVHFTQVVDIDEKAKLAAEKKGHQYYCGTIESFKSETLFDVVLLLNLIEHVADPLSVLQKAGLLLRPHGIIIIKTPNYKSLDARLFKKSYWGGLHCPRHWTLFCKKSFYTISAAASLQVKQFTYTQGAPFWAFSILHYLHRHKIIKADKDHPIIYHPLFALIGFVAAFFDFVRKPFAALSQMFFVLEKRNVQ
jgi:2-polyprenyl-3-methyl-5-hydroxy-6-metoxy-1,4-benzoquinol methylase